MKYALYVLFVVWFCVIFVRLISIEKRVASMEQKIPLIVKAQETGLELDGLISEKAISAYAVAEWSSSEVCRTWWMLVNATNQIVDIEKGLVK
jgi:hypothetical protein